VAIIDRRGGTTVKIIRLVSFVLLLATTSLAAPKVRKPEPKKVTVGPNVVLEIGQTRRVIVTATVCLRKGPLEGLLTRKKKKEHEYILAADIDARHLHTALTLAGAKPGSPVRFEPVYAAAHGTTIKVSLRYEKGGKTVTVPASKWVRHFKTHKALDQDWVFAGSRFVPNSENKDGPPDYIANHGDLICVCNMASAVLDLPVASPKKFEDRNWEINTDQVPADGTKVEVLLEPVIKKKPAGKDKDR
jgi:hypothetical protein